jgi:hypothetical protein
LKDTYECEVTRNGARTAYFHAVAKALLSSLKSQRQISPSVSASHIQINCRTNGNIRVMLAFSERKDSTVFLSSLKELLGPVADQKYMVPRKGHQIPYDQNFEENLHEFFRFYLKGKAKSRLRGYHPVPKVLSKSEKARTAFLQAWNKYVSPAELIEADKRPDLVAKNFANVPSVQDREIWE